MLNTSKVLLNKGWKPLVTSIRRHPYPEGFMHFLANKPKPQYSMLDNGFTIVTEERNTPNACFGFFIDAGARYESDFENGITKFFEQVVFKSTRSRNKTCLQKQMGCVAANFKCFTTREIVGYYVECLPCDVPICMDILSDCVFNNEYDDCEIEKEKTKVYQLMQDHDNDNNAVLEDYLHRTAFQGTPLARTVIGPSSNLYNFNSTTIRRYMNKFFTATRAVLASVGCLKHCVMVDLAKQYFGHMQPLRCVDSDYYRFSGSEIRFRNDELPKALVAVALETPCLCDDDSVVMEIAANMVGGWDRTQPGGRNHAFYAARAASSGLGDAYHSFYITYKDTGLWGVKYEGSSRYLEDMLHCIQEQWMLLCTAVTETDLERGRRIVKTRLLSDSENLTRTCNELGLWTLYHGHRPSLHERITAVDRVSLSYLRETCMRYIYDKCPAVSVIGATEGLPPYPGIRAGMYWLRW